MKKINVDPKDLEPIETDGINLLYIGTFLFALATFGIIYQPNWIDDQMMGTVLGLIGLRIIKRRRKRLGL
jgi:hypothetical protein